MKKLEFFLLSKTDAGVKHYSIEYRWVYAAAFLAFSLILGLASLYWTQQRDLQAQYSLIEEQEVLIATMHTQITNFSDKERQIQFLKSYVDELKSHSFQSESSLKHHQKLYQENIQKLQKLYGTLKQVLNVPTLPEQSSETINDIQETLTWLTDVNKSFHLLEQTIQELASKKTSIEEQESTISQLQLKMSKTEAALQQHLKYVEQKSKNLDEVFKKLKKVTGVDLKKHKKVKPFDNSLARGGPSTSELIFTSLPTEGISPELTKRLSTVSQSYELSIDSYHALAEAIEEQKKLWAATPTLLPLDRRIVSDGYGRRIDPFSSKWDFHAGMDFVGKTGDPIYATADGIVVKAREWYGYGLFVEIDHGPGINYTNNKKRTPKYFTRYGHLSKILVEKGQEVKRGDIIGHVGSTGRSTGPHLHYEVLVNQKHIDPNRLMRYFAAKN